MQPALAGQLLTMLMQQMTPHLGNPAWAARSQTAVLALHEVLGQVQAPVLQL